MPPGLWLRCRYPAGRAGLLDAGLSLRVLLAKAKKPARSRFGVCLGWWLLDLIHRSRGPPSPSTGKAGITSWLFATKSPAGSFHRKRSPFLPEEGRFAAAQDMNFCDGYCRFPDTRKGHPYNALHNETATIKSRGMSSCEQLTGQPLLFWHEFLPATPGTAAGQFHIRSQSP